MGFEPSETDSETLNLKLDHGVVESIIFSDLLFLINKN